MPTSDLTPRSTRPPLRRLGDVWTVELPEVPAGSFDAASTDVITVGSDGAVWWHPRALTDLPLEPVLVTTIDVSVPAHVPTFGGFVNGSLLLHDGDGLTETMAFPTPGAEPVGLGDRGRLAVSPDGARVAARPAGAPAGVVVFDWQAGTATRLGVDEPEHVWAPNGRDLLLLDWRDRGIVIDRRAVDADFAVIASLTLVGRDELISYYAETGEPLATHLLAVRDHDVIVSIDTVDDRHIIAIPVTPDGSGTIEATDWPDDRFAVSPDSAMFLRYVGDDAVMVEFADGRQPIDFPDALHAFFVPQPFVTPG